MTDKPINFEKERSRLAAELGLDYADNEKAVFWQRNKQTEQARREFAALLEHSDESTEMNPTEKEGGRAAGGKSTELQNGAAGQEQAHALPRTPQEAIFTQGTTISDETDRQSAHAMPALETNLPLGLRIRAVFNSLRGFAKSRLERNQAAGIDAQKKEKSKQINTALVGVAGLLVVTVTAVYLAGNTRTRTDSPVRVYKSDFRLEPDALDKQSYQRQYDEKLEDVASRLRTMEELALRLQQELKTSRGQMPKDAGKDVSANESLASAPVNALADFSAQSNAAEAARLSAAMSGSPAGISSVLPEVSHLKRLTVADPVGELEAIRSAARERFAPRRAAAGDTLIAANRARHEAAGTYLPAGSFARAVVLAGATVSTGGTSASNPVPMLLEIKDTARLPNAFRSNIKACFATANATGDLSSERVWIRLERLSCMTRSGKAFDARIQGYVTGDDGKTGVRARLVTRSGQAIASALLTGAISGLGKAVSLSAQDTTTYTSGAVGTTVSDSFRAGLGEGMQSALERIADYYIRLADKIFPCLEIDSGRRVDLILSQGLTIDIDEAEPDKADGKRSRPIAEEQIVVNNSEIFGSEMRAQSLRYE